MPWSAQQRRWSRSGEHLLLGGDAKGQSDEEGLNVRAVLLDTGAVGVAFTGGLIYATGSL